MASKPTYVEASRGADRPREHDGASDAERAIFKATEALLSDTSFRELSVSEIIKEAQISRATFYFYFSSKYAVLTGLLAAVMDEIFEAVRPFIGREEGVDPRAALGESLRRGATLWTDHRAVIRAVSDQWTTVPELRELWAGVVERFTTAVAGEIDRERKAGNAPPGLDSRKLAAVLLWGSERCFHVAGLGVDADLGDEQEVVAPLLALWVGAIYQDAPPPA